MARKPNSSKQTEVLLGALLSQPDAWRHGYELSQEVSLRSGTLYPILMRLQDQGWLESRWEDESKHGRPPRHLYRLTAHGAGEAHALLAASQLPSQTAGVASLPEATA